MKKFFKIFGLTFGIGFGVLLAAVILIVIFSDGDQVSKEASITLEDYKKVKTTKENGLTNVEIARDNNNAELDSWTRGFSENAVTVLEEEFKNEDTQKVRIFENSTFIDENGKEKEDVLFDVTVTRDTADQLEYDNFKSMVYTEPFRLFNKAEQYYIHVGMFMNELSPELQNGFDSGFEKKLTPNSN